MSDRKDEENVIVWVTKYALTTGILQVTGTVHHFRGVGTMFSWRDEDARSDQCAHGLDWHRDEDSAKLRADAMRKKKIKNLEKQIEKLKNLSFG